MAIFYPHIKRDDGFALHKEATQKGYYVKDVHGKDYDGWCWSGASSYLDILNLEIGSWWDDKFSLSCYKSSTPSLYIWNDMNEPSVFNSLDVCYCSHRTPLFSFIFLFKMHIYELQNS